MSLLAIQIFKLGSAWLVSAALLSTPLPAAKSVTHYSATWTFSEDRPTGVFANGEPWVVGPVTITSIVPDSVSLADSGSMRVVVPNTFQGFTGKLLYSAGLPPTGVYYKAELDLSIPTNLPATLAIGEMIMTARGQKITGEVRSTTNEICVLTVLNEVPPEGSFRPSLFSTTPRTVQFNKSNINYSILKNFDRVPSTPSKATIGAFLPALPWFEYDSTWMQSSYGPANNFATNGQALTYPNASSVYGREIAYKWGNVALWLNTANTQEVKEKAMIQTIQCGLDIASFVRHGGVFNADGGHKVGRKFPMLLAGLALNDPEILALAADQVLPRFSEDQSTFTVKQADVGRVVNGGIEAQYVQADVGLPNWGVKHFNAPNNDDSRWDTGVPYRYVTWPAMVGSILAVDLMGQRAAWNHPAIFDYNQRFKDRHGIGNGFDGQMWSRYKESLDGGPSAPQRVKIKR